MKKNQQNSIIKEVIGKALAYVCGVNSYNKNLEDKEKLLQVYQFLNRNIEKIPENGLESKILNEISCNLLELQNNI